jgi:transposase-like protein
MDEPSMARARSLSEFQEAFSDEACCAAFLFKCRWPDGFVCPACGAPRGVALNSRPRLFECLDCGRQTSITAGTVMHRSKLPLTMWFWAAHLMATHSNGMSARQLADQLGVTYKTAWLLTQKLRRSKSNPDRDPLEGESDAVKACPGRDPGTADKTAARLNQTSRSSPTTRNRASRRSPTPLRTCRLWRMSIRALHATTNTSVTER